MPGMTVEDLLSGQTMTAAAVPGLYAEGQDLTEEAPPIALPDGPRTTGWASLIFGFVGMVAWLLPCIGFPVGVSAIVLVVRVLPTEDRVKGLVTIVLGAFSIVFGLVWLLVLRSWANSIQ